MPAQGEAITATEIPKPSPKTGLTNTVLGNHAQHCTRTYTHIITGYKYQYIKAMAIKYTRQLTLTIQPTQVINAIQTNTWFKNQKPADPASVSTGRTLQKHGMRIHDSQLSQQVYQTGRMLQKHGFYT